MENFDFKKINILAVDDSAMVLRMLEKSLGSIFSFKGMCKPLSALKYAEVKKVDLFILDIEMPDMNGIELMEHIRENPKCKDSRIIFLTGNKEKDMIEKASDMSADGVIIKPIQLSLLLQKICNVLGADASEISGLIDEL